MADEVFNDSTIPHGTCVVTIQETGLSYDADADAEIGLDKVKVVKRYKANGAARDSFGVADFVEGSLTIQIPTTATPNIRGGQLFTTDKTGARVFRVTDAGRRFPKDSYDVQPISYIEKLV